MKRILILAAKMSFIAANGMAIMFTIMLLDNATADEFYDLLLLGFLLPISLLMFGYCKWGYKDVFDLLGKFSKDDDL